MSSDLAEPLADSEMQQTETGPMRPSARPRSGMALCLSGGGFRASLFHLGALRRLNELGVLAQIDTFSCVSGGSIVGGHLATAIVRGLRVVNGRYADFDRVLDEFLTITARDIRTGPALARAKFWQARGKAPRALEQHYESLIGATPLSELPEHPRFIFCATDLFFATSWICERVRIGDYACGYVTPPPKEWTIAKAIALSSCFPPVFDPAWADLREEQFASLVNANGTPRSLTDAERDRIREARSKVTLTDGGVYDNLGLEPVWKRHKTVLVSDGGKPLQQEYVPPGLRLMRYQDVIQNQVLALRKRWLVDIYRRAKEDPNGDVFTGAYWGIPNSTTDYVPASTFGYSKTLAALLADIRTDLNPFSPNEVAVLDKHGYELADVAVRTHVPHLMKFPEAPLRPHYSSERLRDERLVADALAWSGSRIKSTFTSSSSTLLTA